MKTTHIILFVLVLSLINVSELFSGIKGKVIDINENPVEATVYCNLGWGDNESKSETINGEFVIIDNFFGGQLLAIPKDSIHVPGYYKKDIIATYYWENASNISYNDTNDIKTIILDTITPINGPGSIYGEIDAIEYPCIELKKDKPQNSEDSVIIFVYIFDDENRPRKVLMVKNHLFCDVMDPIEYSINNLDTGSYKIIADAFRFKNYQYPFNFKITTDSLNYENNIYFYGGGSVEENTNIKEIKIQPNPVSDYLNLSFNTTHPEFRISIFNYYGIEIYNEKFYSNSEENNANINLSGNPNGFYFLKIASGDDYLTRPIIILK